MQSMIRSEVKTAVQQVKINLGSDADEPHSSTVDLSCHNDLCGVGE